MRDVAYVSQRKRERKRVIGVAFGKFETRPFVEKNGTGSIVLRPK